MSKILSRAERKIMIKRLDFAKIGFKELLNSHDALEADRDRLRRETWRCGSCHKFIYLGENMATDEMECKECRKIRELEADRDRLRGIIEESNHAVDCSLMRWNQVEECDCFKSKVG